MFALVDCNNFYASCERVYNPKLEGRPIIVLSNNDGCAIARSEEAKALGIEMGTPAFMIEDMIRQQGIEVFSSNYALYGDLSNRVMTILSGFAPQVELYSIDEAFLDVSELVYEDLDALGQEIRRFVRQCTGIPVSVGIAPTKTLAKMANRYAKKRKKGVGVHWLKGAAEIAEVLDFTAVGDIWGVGPERAKLLLRNGFKTAADLSRAPDDWVLKQMTVVGHRLLNELRGIPSIEWELETPAKKNICTSRSFGKLITDKEDLIQAVANYTAACAEKLRKQQSCAGKLQLFLQTNPHRTEDRQYYRSITMPIAVATNNTPELTKAALLALSMIFREGFNYMKCGVTVMDLVPAGEVQAGLFDRQDREKDQRVMQAMDKVNRAFGQDFVRFAVQGYEKRYKLRQANLSGRYTTRIEEIVIIRK